jgi:hypothetical protein
MGHGSGAHAGCISFIRVQVKLQAVVWRDPYNDVPEYDRAPLALHSNLNDFPVPDMQLHGI